MRIKQTTHKNMGNSLANSSIKLPNTRRLADNKHLSYNPTPRLTLKDVKIREIISEK